MKLFRFYEDIFIIRAIFFILQKGLFRKKKWRYFSKGRLAMIKKIKFTFFGAKSYQYITRLKKILIHNFIRSKGFFTKITFYIHKFSLYQTGNKIND